MGEFSRSLTLPDGVDADSIHAHFDRGVLEIQIPQPEQKKPKAVQIAPGASGQASVFFYEVGRNDYRDRAGQPGSAEAITRARRRGTARLPPR